MDGNEFIEEICEKVPEFIPLYGSRVRHYIIRHHIINVYNQFEKYFSIGFDKCDIEWFRLFLILHDLGKSIAYKNGNLSSQNIETINLIEKYKTELDLSDKHHNIFKALLRANTLGKYMESKIHLDDSYSNILEQCKIIEMEIDKFFYFLSVYYQCDVASYTGDAGGIPYLEFLFEYQNGEKIYCEKDKLLKFSKVYSQKYFALLQEIKLKSVPNEKIVNRATNDFNLKVLGKIDLSKFEKLKKEIKNDKENIYIIDTNVFVDCPDIITKIEKKYKVILSAKVIDELDRLKNKLPSEYQRQNVQKAIKKINESFDNRNVKMDIAELNLLPADFDKKSPDNFILSVALKYQDKNPIMLTSDNGLQLKSKGLGITTINLKDYLKQIKY